MKSLLIIALILFGLSSLGNWWQHRNPTIYNRITTVTDTLVVYEQLPADTVLSTIIKYVKKTVVDSTKTDSLQALLDSVSLELDKGQMRVYIDRVQFESGDSLHTKIKGILFDKVEYTFFPAAREVRVVTNTNTIYKDSRDAIWFSVIPTIGIMWQIDKLYADLDLLLMFRKYGLGFSIDSNGAKGIKVAKVWDVAKISFLP